MTIELSKITNWLIRADQPFMGHVQSVILPDGTVAFSNGLTPDQYAKDRGFPVRVITDAELDVLLASHEASLITAPVEITDEQYHELLNCLPPCRWRTVAGVEMFHVSER